MIGTMTATEDLVNQLNEKKYDVDQDLIKKIIEEWSMRGSNAEPFIQFFADNETGLDDFGKNFLCSNKISGASKAQIFNKLYENCLLPAESLKWFHKILETSDATDRIDFITMLQCENPKCIIDIFTDTKERNRTRRRENADAAFEDTLKKYIDSEILNLDLTNEAKLNILLACTKRSGEVLFNRIFAIICEKINNPNIEIQEKVNILKKLICDNDFRKKLESFNEYKHSPSYNQLFMFFIENSKELVSSSSTSETKDFFNEIAKHVFRSDNKDFLSNLDIDKIETNDILLEMMSVATAKAMLNSYQTILNPKSKKETILSLALATAYLENSDIFHEFIYIGAKGNQIKEPQNTKPTPNISVIYNNEEHFVTKNIEPNYILGNPLQLANQQKTPIGYNIHLPQGVVKEIVVNVYGGYEAQDLHIKAFRPGVLTDMDKQLLSNGIGVVYLNLNDLVELNVFQCDMPEDIHARLHESINKFYETIKAKPESLDPRLSKIKGAKLYLHGASFGGRTAVRHAELYPRTFDGYISHDGWMDMEKAIQSSSILTGGPRTGMKWLDPASPEHLKKLSDPVLIMQNLDDNNLNAKIAFRFINKAKKLGKANLIKLHLEKIGNPIPGRDDMYNKGHYAPSRDAPGFGTYTKALTAFIQEKNVATPDQTLKKSYKNRKIANRFYIKSTVLKRFIAESMLTYTHNRHNLGDLKHEAIWKTHYEPKANSEFFVSKLLSDQTQLSDEIKRFKDNNLLTDETIKAVLKKELPLFISFFSEYNSIVIPENIDINDLIENRSLIKAVRETFFGLGSPAMQNSDYKENHCSKLLNALYQTNPRLLPDLESKYLDYQSTINSFKDKMIETAERFEKLKLKALHEKSHNQFMKNLNTASEETTKLVLLASEEVINPKKSSETLPKSEISKPPEPSSKLKKR
ncbi:MAG: prolyl oligopeptidase family serine peptidase [Gammaproteobacteria bacterium]